MGANPSSSWSRPDLGQSFEEWSLLAEREKFIGLSVLPIFDVAKQTANFTTVDIAQLLMDRNVERASGSGYARQDWTFTQGNYTTQEYGAEELIDDREKSIYAYAIDIETISTQRAQLAVLRALERRISAAVFNATTFASFTAAVTNEWDDATNATPIDDIITAQKACWDKCGYVPRTMICNWKVATNLKKCNQIIDWVKYSGRDDPKIGAFGLDALAAALNLDRIIVSESAYNSANKGQSASLSPIWSNEYVMLAKLATSNDLKEPCLGRVFSWGGDGGTPAGTVDMYRDEEKRSDVVRVRHDLTEKILYADCGYLLSNITT